MTENLVSYQSMYATLSAEITANICKIEQLSKESGSETAGKNSGHVTNFSIAVTNLLMKF